MDIDIKALLAEHPNPHLHYYDNGRWILFKKEPSDDEDAELNEIASGGPEDCQGYLPPIVKSLCEALGITVNSV